MGLGKAATYRCLCLTLRVETSNGIMVLGAKIFIGVMWLKLDIIDSSMFSSEAACIDGTGFADGFLDALSPILN